MPVVFDCVVVKRLSMCGFEESMWVVMVRGVDGGEESLSSPGGGDFNF